jgi:hypothetical protein
MEPHAMVRLRWVTSRSRRFSPYHQKTVLFFGVKWGSDGAGIRHAGCSKNRWADFEGRGEYEPSRQPNRRRIGFPPGRLGNGPTLTTPHVGAAPQRSGGIERCPCGSGKKCKKCCGGTPTLEYLGKCRPYVGRGAPALRFSEITAHDQAVWDRSDGRFWLSVDIYADRRAMQLETETQYCVTTRWR